MSVAPVTTPGGAGALSGLAVVAMFASFALAYFLSSMLRGVIATLAPEFSRELALDAGELGLLAGAYFIGFAAMQLPLGSALDRFGPKRVLLGFLAVAVMGNAAFAAATNFASLTFARVLIGVGVAACLMAPMTAFRHRLAPHAQMRANSWMLMTGALGLVASTLPVQWLLPVLGWRGLFWGVAALLLLAMALITLTVPRDHKTVAVSGESGNYLQVFRHPTFLRFLPLGFFHYGGMVALQSLWVGPWLSRVCGWTATQAAGGLFAINLTMLCTFFTWGALVPRLYARGWTAQRLVARGVPVGLGGLLLGIGLGSQATTWVWVLFCVATSVMSLAQPAVGQAFAATLAGRALSAFNLVIFAGVFVMQWGIGLAIDRFQAWGWGTVSSFRGAFALYALCCVFSYLWFLWRDDRMAIPSTAKSAP